jgi:hypothetical protein
MRFGHDRFSDETFDRLLWSNHVEDLRWIAQLTIAAVVVAVIVVIAIGLIEPALTHHTAVVAANDTATTPHLPASGDDKASAFDPLKALQVSAILATVGAIIAWCYQSGSARLGIVDLFACEITTLCRICTINAVTDTCVDAFKNTVNITRSDDRKVLESTERFSHFDSEETYTPIFDGSAKDLQILSVKVVTNITAFYAYWKATRDAFRKLANTPAGKPDVARNDDSWHRAMRSVIYMQYLAFESARKSVRDLIEFQPSWAENTITILICELPAYRFLLDHFPKEDVRYTRLELREKRYRYLVPDIYYRVRDEYERYVQPGITDQQMRQLDPEGLEELQRNWAKADGMLNELRGRYEAAFGEFPQRQTLRQPEQTQASARQDARGKIGVEAR